MATEAWRFQHGTADQDYIDAAAAGPNGTYVFVGTTRGDWSEPNAGIEDWVVFKVDSERNILWRWQYGTEKQDITTAVAMAEDESIVVVGHRRQNPGFLAAKLDADGTLLWQREDGTAGVDNATGLALVEDGSAVLSGSTTGDWNVTNLGGTDFAALKLDADGELLWKWQNGTSSDDKFEAIALVQDGSFILTGSSEGDWKGPNKGSVDFVALKIDPDGNEVWRWQDGTTDADTFSAVSVGKAGSVFLAGRTTGDWSGKNRGGDDFAACKLDADGNEVWRWQDGTAEEDHLLSILVGDNESVIIAGHTKGDWDMVNAGDGDFAAVKLDAHGTYVWSWQAGTNGDDGAHAIVSGASNSECLVAGFANGKWLFDTLGKRDFAAVLLNTSVPADSDPMPTPTWIPTPGNSPPLFSTPFVQTPQPSERPSEATPGPTLHPFPSSSRPTSLPPMATDGAPNITTGIVIVVVLSCILCLIGAVAGGRLYRRYSRQHNDHTVSHSVPDAGSVGQRSEVSFSHVGYSSGDISPSRISRSPSNEGDSRLDNAQERETVPRAVSSVLIGVAAPFTPNAEEANAAGVSTPVNNASRGVGRTKANDGSHQEQTPPSSGSIVALPVSTVPEANGSGVSTDDSRPNPASSGLGIRHAVISAAEEVSLVSQIPGVAEVAKLVIVLMNLLKDHAELTSAGESTVKRCRSVLLLVKRAADVLDEVDNSVDKAHRALIEDVRDAVSDVVDLIKTYRSKGKIAQVMRSTLFKRRQTEAEAVIEAAISRLHAGSHLKKLGQDVGERQQPWLDETEGNLICEARRLRRQRNLDTVEIPEGYVTVTDELLGKGGFGAVYIADYNGRNAAAKVVQVQHDLGGLNTLNEETPCGIEQHGKEVGAQRARRKAFWRELQAMIRLRSPHTVNVYGAITSCEGRLVLLMELLPGGDLRALLKDAAEPLAVERAHSLVRDICAGMAFLHLKETVHGDLKSPNVLLDGCGRAKIGDFGTSRWPQLTNSTGLVTHTTHTGHSTQMSFAWAAPEVLESKGTSYASDVYSFGIVMWEVLSRNSPWANEACPRDIYARVVFKGDRPEIPSDAPGRMARIMVACWAGEPEARPTFSGILKWLDDQ